MSDPPHQPLAPLYSGAPEIHYDSQGNAYQLECDGNFVPYHGPPDARAHDALSLPMQHAFQFSLRPVQDGPSQQSIPIDPALQTALQTPLPCGPYLDLTHPGTIADAKGLKCADKVAGSCGNGKGKECTENPPKKRQRVHCVLSGSDNNEPLPKCSTSYGKSELQNLFATVEEQLPIGQKGWKEVKRRYNKWVKATRHTVRPPKALENKFQGYLRLKKPMGNAECPPEVKHVHELEALMNEHVGTCELSNAESQSDNDSPDVEVTAVARRAPSPPMKRKARASGGDLAEKLFTVFDPESQRAHDNAHANRSFANTQVITLTQQLCDTQALSESLLTQNTVLQNRVHDLERANDRAVIRAELMSEFTQRSEPDCGRTRLPSPPRRSRSRKNKPGIDRVNGKIRCEHIYPDGGATTYWLSDPSTDD
ncbi:hypothetical protein DFH08DRAFT_993844 [Mycena albidolilacea]|uniref:Uncharacterized protein n=1 Tax=Mycena albidolilacea TaxID=1033008 RepID=A0AAD6YYF7_9AGAR|nr:hypothetical protein DFH08DRAFT_993844 [Mycena albidolilacea]